MDKAEILQFVCRLALDYNNIGTKSIVQLVEQSGYAKDPTAVTLSAVESVLRDHPDQCDAWYDYSEDKRTTSGWYVSEGRQEYIVGYYPNGPTLSFADRVAACAAYAIRELESITSRGGQQ